MKRVRPEPGRRLVVGCSLRGYSYGTEDPTTRPFPPFRLEGAVDGTYRTGEIGVSGRAGVKCGSRICRYVTGMM